MDYESFLELVKRRRSIRRFKPDPIPEDHVDKIIEAARWAPSGFNMQPWEFVVVKKQELKDNIVDAINEYRAQANRMEVAREAWQGTKWPGLPVEEPNDYKIAPVFIILFGDTRAHVGVPMAGRFNYQRNQALFTSSLASAFLYMHLAATALGLASQWVTSVTDGFVHCMVKDLLGIPMEMEIYDMMAVGYPASKPSRKFVRSREEMVHYEDCGREDFRTDEQVKDFVKKARTWTMSMIRRG